MATNCFVERPRTSTDPFYSEFDKLDPHLLFFFCMFFLFLVLVIHSLSEFNTKRKLSNFHQRIN
jgi:hypothetical protein